MIDKGIKLDLFRSMANHFKNSLYFMTSGKNDLDNLDNYRLSLSSSQLPPPKPPPKPQPSSSSSSSININDGKTTIRTSNNTINNDFQVIMNGLVSTPFYYGENQINDYEDSKISDIRKQINYHSG